MFNYKTILIEKTFHLRTCVIGLDSIRGKSFCLTRETTMKFIKNKVMHC
uniref:Uncharacterized protein n=1 Tax=Rhizophora mucronata TaxID=61149 RepID=A0A2P2PRN5_RHIMU